MFAYVIKFLINEINAVWVLFLCQVKVPRQNFSLILIKCSRNRENIPAVDTKKEIDLSWGDATQLSQSLQIFIKTRTTH